jgi:hypothetical protein
VSAEFGWQPTFHFSRRWAVVAPIEFSRFINGNSVSEYHWYNALSPGVAAKFSNLLVSQVQASARFTTKVDGLPWSSQGHGTPEIGVLAFGGKMRLTLFRIADRQRGDRTNHFAGTISVADANGFLYWITR